MSTEFTGPHYLEPLGIDFQVNTNVSHIIFDVNHDLMFPDEYILR